MTIAAYFLQKIPKIAAFWSVGIFCSLLLTKNTYRPESSNFYDTDGIINNK